MGLEMVEITMDVEDHFGISLPDVDAGNIKTYGDLVDLVAEIVAQTHPDRDTKLVDSYLRNMLINEYSIKPIHITRDAELYGPNLNLG